MARKKIREFDAKKLITENITKYGKVSISFNSIPINPKTNLEELQRDYPWLTERKLVVKPDQLFGKRKKHDLVLINANYNQVIEFIENNRNKEVTIGKVTGKLTHFLIEPFVEHEKEYYLSITSDRTEDVINFSTEGGIDIEENWERVIKIHVPTLIGIEEIKIEREIPDLPNKEVIVQLIKSVYKFFQDLDFSYLELNPFTFDNRGNIHLLDTVAQVDSCAHFKNHNSWKELSFPKEFGKEIIPEEEYINKIDQDSGASLKLNILNQKGRIWNILSGGGASIILLDTIADLKKHQEISNYGEYSGNPSTEESYQYAKTILKLMNKEYNPEGKSLFIAGGIANVTDIGKTFTGVIKAMEECQEELRAGKIKVYVRRGGPNQEKGIKLMREACRKFGVPMSECDLDLPMTKIISTAVGEL